MFMFNVLIADDERLERLAMRKNLEEHFPQECHILEAEHGSAALALMEENLVHIAILDIKMPGINGIEVAREMRNRHPDCKIIMLTGYTYFNYAKECISIGVMEFMVKPFWDQDLADNIRRAMNLILEKEKAEISSVSTESADLQEEANKANIENIENIENKENKEEIEEIRETEKTWKTVVEKILKEQYGDNLSMEEVASQVGFSGQYFCRMFKQEFSVNFVDYLSDIRMKNACELLKHPDASVKEVCFQVGYSEPNYFSRVFKKVYGVTPSQYQKNARMTK